MGEGPGKGMRTGRSRRRWQRPYMAALAAGALAVGGAASATAASASTSSAGAAGSAVRPASATASRTGAWNTTTPIKHLVVIFQENVSFDHYFGTYPKAANTSGQWFRAARNTPRVNNLVDTKGAGGKGNLLTNNPNTDASGNQVNPRRL